jgi:transposase
MRGTDERTGELFSYVDLEDRVPAKHPLRLIRRIVNDVLRALDGEFAKLYADSGRPSIAPERLLRALLLQAFYTIRSESQLMEQLNYNLLYRWFVALGIDEPVWVQTVFTKNRERLLEAEVAHKFLAELLNHKEVRGLLSDEHFSVDGTQIQAWASMKSFRGRAAGGRPQWRARLPWREAQQRHAYLDHRPGSEAPSQGQRQGGQALLYRQRHDREPSRAGGGGRARRSDRHHRARGGTDDGGALFTGLATPHARC